MTTQFFGLVRTSFFLTGLYLVLKFAGGATGLITAGTDGWAKILRTLQAR